MRTERISNNMISNRIPSCSTMGYLTMIIAIAPAGVAAFSGLETPLKKPTLKSSVWSSTSSTYNPRRSQEPGFRTELYYISETSNNEFAEPPTSSQQQEEQKHDGHGPVWWNSIFSREESSAADEYLEFLDRRYNRILHDDSNKVNNTNKAESSGFSVLNWLYSSGTGTSHAHSTEADVSPSPKSRDNALYVLGVANLASKKLLQKHHRLRESLEEPSMSSNNNNKKMLEATDAEIVADNDDSAVTAATTASPLTVSRLFRQVAQGRQGLVRSQMMHFRLALAFLIKTLVTSPVKAVRKLYAMGGGKKSMAVAFAVVAALPIILRPILKSIAAEGANTMSP